MAQNAVLLTTGVCMCVRAAGVGHLDVLLLHWPPASQHLPSFWRALVDAKRRGLAKAIGLSNVGVSHLAVTVIS